MKIPLSFHKFTKNQLSQPENYINEGKYFLYWCKVADIFNVGVLVD
ncbi:hypothetical protein RintRC_5204 [Richelia intracellularis]|nr:hypothetical protein RintRC_5204 [Richelia intracellularis]